MLTLSVLSAPLGPLSEFFYLHDYWNPALLGGFRVGFEDALFAFAIGGIAAVLYEELRGTKQRVRKRPRYGLLWMSALGIAWMFLSVFILGINSIYASIALFLFFGAITIFLRHDLVKDAFMSGLYMAFLMLGFYVLYTTLFPGIIQAWWSLDNISGVLVLGAPIEELAWGFGWGFMAGPSYEFLTGRVLVMKGN